MDNFAEFLDNVERFQIIIWPSLATIIATTWAFWNKIKAKKHELITADNEKRAKRNAEALKKWEHQTSLEVICSIKQLCNLYKDRSNCERVSYGQLENGTLAASELCNMFISWLAEDDRYGKLSKQVRYMQRIQYSEVVDWLETMRKSENDPATGYMAITSKQNNLLQIINRVYRTPVGSQLAIPVNDPAGIFIGFCIFDYGKDNFNGLDKDYDIKLLKNFKVAIESIIYDYHVRKEAKRRELGG